ncbi:DNA polymerase III subunit gamma/tau [Pelotomaculum propionicicum]|uniref:DNA polymerase III subunit gamma/tau n=1 Tax=Pelotomaculum propionicicum TaxID=258475 RepID=UPI003B7B7F4C
MTYLALYRKWRPQTFGEIIGQEHITRTLKNAVESGRTGHAYLFCGTRGTGKTTTAKVLAKALNCTERVGPEPCNRCEVCKNITDGLSVDVIEIDAASNRGIDEIRDLREKIKFAPAVAKYRVYIIDEVHMLTNEAFNALLKTLEEPPRHAVLILATTEPHKVPLTILSRCQRFDFRRIEPADIIKRLSEVAAGANLEVEAEALRLIARAAEGGLRDALSILDQGAAFGELKITVADVHNILGTVRIDALNRMAGHLAAGETGSALNLVADLTSEGKDLRFFAREMAAYLRALLLEKIVPGSSAREAWGDPAMMAAKAAEFTTEGLLRAVEIMAGTEQEMKWSSQPGIILELALVKACRAVTLTRESSLLARLEALEEKLNKPVQAAPAEKAGTIKKAAPGAGKPAGLVRAGLPGETIKDPAGRGEKPYQPASVETNPDPGRSSEEPGRGPQPAGTALERVKNSWREIMNIMRRERLPLYYNYLRAQPLDLKGESLVVGFPEGEGLAREMADRPEQKKYLESLLKRILKGEWQVSFKSYRGTIEPSEKRHDDLDKVVDVKRRFGGEEIILDGEDEGSLF